MRKIVVLIFLVSGLFSYTQNNGLESGAGSLGKLTLGKPMNINFNSSKELVGSEYLDIEFKSAKIITNEEKTTTVDARFNTYAQEIEIKLNGEVLALNHNIVKSVELDEKTFVPIKDESSKFIFAEVLVNGNLSLYKKYKAIIKEGKIKEGIQTETPKDKIVIKEYFLVHKVNSEAYSLLKLKKKTILEIFNNDKEVISFVKDNKLSYKKLEDVIKIFLYFNKENTSL